MSNSQRQPHLIERHQNAVRGGRSAGALALAALATVALASGAGAAAKRLVSGADIRNNTITGVDVRNESLTGADVRNGQIRTPDLGSGAVTNAKLALGAITADRIADGAVGAAKLASGSVGTAQLADGSVTAGKLAAGAVPAYTAGTGLALTGSEFSARGNPDAKTVSVAKAGGEFTSIQSAIDSITDESSSNPYVVQVGPGVFEERVTVPQHVELRGSGPDSTIIRAGGAASEAGAAVVTAAASGGIMTTISNLWIDNTGGSAHAVGLLAPDTSYLTIRDVTVTTATASTASYAVLLDEYTSVFAWDLRIISSSNNSPVNSGVRIQGSTSPGYLYLYGGDIQMSDGTNVRGIDIANDDGALVDRTTISVLNGTNTAGVRAANGAYVRLRWTAVEARSGSGTNAPIQTLGATVDVLSSHLESNTDGASASIDFAAGSPVVTVHGSVLAGADDWLAVNSIGTIRAAGNRLENEIGGPFSGLATYTCGNGTNVNQSYATLNASCV